MKPHHLIRSIGVAVAACLLTAVSACGGGAGGAPDGGASAAGGAQGELPTVQKSDQVAALVPDDVRKQGSITVVMSTSSPPAHFESEDGGMVGVDVDLAKLLGQVMGLEVKVQGVPLDQIIPGLQAHRYDLVLSQFSPTAERAEVVDFVNYAQSGTSLGVAGGNPKKLGFDTLCGAKVGVQKGSSQSLEIVPQLDQECAKQGKGAVAMQTFRDSSTAVLALQSSRVDGVLLDTPVLGYAAQQSGGKIESVGTIESAPVAVGSVKGSGMEKAIQAALQELESDGAYVKVLTRWGLQDTALKSDQFAINDIRG